MKVTKLGRGFEEVGGVTEVLERHRDWLNAHHRANGEPELGVGLGQYLELEGDEPAILLNEILSDSRGKLDRRMLVVSCSPYHDEGGHSILTAWFRDGELDAVAQEFDTYHDMIWTRSMGINEPWPGGEGDD